MNKAYSYYLIFFLLLITVGNTFSQKTTKIVIKKADVLTSDKIKGKEVRKLVGNVVFSHDKALMYCDSAYFFQEENSLTAYSRIKIEQGDSLQLFGDSLVYDGNLKLAKLRGNVLMKHFESTLKTRYLDYDRQKNVGYYFNHGTIVDQDNILNSFTGFYYSDTRCFTAIDSVILNNPRYDMESDTLNYFTDTKIAYFLGPSTIVSDSNNIYCENGWYDTENDESRFSKNAVLSQKEKILYGDSLVYNRNTGIGECFKNVILKDTIQEADVYGNYAFVNEIEDYAFITDSALLVQKINDEDTLFIHADTLMVMADTLNDEKIINAYFGVKMYSYGFQAKCDSLSYTSVDSLIKLYDEPVLWNEENQMTADFIYLHQNKNEVDYVMMEQSAFIISRNDSSKYNQLNGRTMKAYIKDNELYKVDVMGNGRSIYFAEDEDGIIGVNSAESSNMVIFINDKNVDKIIFLTKPDAILKPIEDVSISDTKLEGFVWLSKYRPIKKSDIFVK